MAWIDSQVVESLHLSTPVLAKWLTGVERMPKGLRRSEMERLVHDLLRELIGPRVLTFDQEAAKVHSTLMSRTAAKGLAISFADCQIASIAVVHGLTVATRDVSPFIAMGVPVINPWDEDPGLK